MRFASADTDDPLPEEGEVLAVQGVLSQQTWQEAVELWAGGSSEAGVPHPVPAPVHQR